MKSKPQTPTAKGPGPPVTKVRIATVPLSGAGMLPIVGLGGSAGGIQALQEFFAAMPVDSGMAFVVIMHLSPEHESTLAEMFQRSTAMPVVVAKDGATVQANSVYVIPPGKFLASANGHLRLSEAQEPRGRRVAVDFFFRTLAETHGEQSVAVVFSGAGGDGALGLKRVKELGGLTIAQDPDEAEHSDMPRAAIATGVVDWVLGVKEMPARLLAYMQHRGELKLPAEDGPHPAQPAGLSPDEHEAALRDVLAFLRTRTGRDFSYYKRATILRLIARRMQVNGLADLPGYLAYLRTHAGEAGALLQDLLISVTNFFRDPESFTVLERIVPELFADKGPGDSVRVWVAGCATGEEAYSIAILLCEHARTLEVPPQIQVLATDLHEDVIREARDGIYPETIATDVSEERLRRFFLHEHGGYRVRREVRELVLFAPHDLLKDSPFSRLDLVSCRNLLIYLNREAQQRAFDIFHFALRPGGRLFLGTSETVEEGSPLFAVIDKKQRLYLQRPGPRQILPMPSGPSTLARALELQQRWRERPTVPGRVTVESVRSGPDATPPFDTGLAPGELHYRLIERFSPPSILVNAAHDIVHLSDAAGRFLQIAGGEPTRNLLRAVHPMLRLELRAALHAAKQTQTAATAFHVPVEMGEERGVVDIRVTPAGDLAPDFLLVVFEAHPADGPPAVAVPRSAEADQAAQHLERELEATKAHLRETIEESEASTEELKASNEELQAMNEELRSATEELETSREELQSINEELTTVNDDLKSNVDQLARSNSDLQNLMAATDIATIFLDRDLRIMRFTPSAQTLFNFIPTDLGRPLSDLSHKLDYPEIVADAERALAHLQPAEREVSAGDRCFLARTLPYRTADEHIAGVVLTFLDITERKSSEEKLRQSEQELADFFDQATVGLHWVGPDGIILRANQAELNLLGYTRNEYIGRAIADFHADCPVIEDILRKLSGGEELHDYPARLRCKNGAIRDVLISSNVFWEDGRFVHTRCFTRDITDRKRAEEALRESEERYRTLFASAPMAVFACDQNAVIQHYNARAVELWGREPVCGVEQHCGSVKLWLPDGTLLLHTQSPMVEMLRTGIPVNNVEVFIERPDGSRLPVLVNFAALKNVQGKITGAISSFIDLTERKASEEELRQSEARKDAVLKCALDAIVTIDHEGNFVEFNPAAERIFGYARADVIGRPMAELIIPHRLRARHHAGLAHYLATGEGPVLNRQIELPALRADGTEFAAELAIIPVSGTQPPLFTAFLRDITERKEAEEGLRQSEERFRAIADNIPQLAWLANAEPRVVWFNQAWLDYTGTTLEDNVGEGWKAVHHPDYIEAVAEKFERHLREGKDWEDTFPLRGKDGDYRWFLSRMKAIRDEGGSVVRFFGTNTDITGRKRSEEAIARLAALVESSDDGLFGQDVNGIITSWNRGAEQIFGYRTDEIVGTPIMRLIPAEAQAEERELQRKIAAGERVGNFETMRQAKDGRQFPVSITVSPLKDGDGKVIGASKVVRDISERAQAEAALRESEQRMRLATEATQVGLWEWNVLTGAIRWDAQLFRIYGIEPTPAGMVDYSDWSGAVLPEDLAENERILQDTVHQAGRRVRRFRIRRRTDGACRHIESVETARANAQGQTEWIVGTNLDITERMEAEFALRTAKEAAENANQSKDRFLAVLSHELRTPLTPVLMVVSALEHDPDLRPDVREDLVMIKRNVELETKLIDDLLDLSRITSGKVVLHRETVDLNEVVRQVCEICQPPLREQNVRLETDLTEDVCEISADRARLQQVLWNVVKNAVKFTPAEGRVRVTTARLAPDRCEVRVQDSGIGIPSELLPRIFAAFEQGDANVTRQFGGLGLGLAISRGLVELHGGTIRAESPGPGQGATFIIEVPSTPQQVTAPKPAAPEQARPTALRLLVVEDHADTSRALKRLLSLEGFAVTSAGDVASALALARNETFDFLVSDLGLPDASGYELMAQMQDIQPLRGIAMSGYGMEEDVRQSLAAGFSDHLVKPLKIPQLLAAIQRLRAAGDQG